MWRGKRHQITNTILKDKNKVRELTLVNFKHYKATVIETVWYWCKVRQHRSIEQNRNPEKDPHIYGHLNFNKIAKWRNSVFSQQMVLEQLDTYIHTLKK